MNKLEKLLLILIFFGITFKITAQTPTDGVFIPKKSICPFVIYSTESYKNYWEGELKRQNENMGTFTNQSTTMGAVFGVSDRFNLEASVPYVKTSASAGIMHGMQGFQDLTATAKYRIATINNLSLIATLGGSLPTNNYLATNLPFSIGLLSKTAFARGILFYQNRSGLAATFQGGYIVRDNINTDIPVYYLNNKAYFTGEMTMPDIVNLSGKFGYYSYRWQLEGTYYQDIVGGTSDIHMNDMPMACNKMDVIKFGVLAAYRIPALKDLQIIASANYAVAGRNVGQTTNVSVGISKILNFWKNRPAGMECKGAVCLPPSMSNSSHESSIGKPSKRKKIEINNLEPIN